MSFDNYEFVADDEPEILKEFFNRVKETLDFDFDNAPHCEGVMDAIRELIEDTESQLERVQEILCE